MPQAIRWVWSGESRIQPWLVHTIASELNAFSFFNSPGTRSVTTALLFPLFGKRVLRSLTWPRGAPRSCQLSRTFPPSSPEFRFSWAAPLHIGHWRSDPSRKLDPEQMLSPSTLWRKTLGYPIRGLPGCGQSRFRRQLWGLGIPESAPLSSFSV